MKLATQARLLEFLKKQNWWINMNNSRFEIFTELVEIIDEIKLWNSK